MLRKYRFAITLVLLICPALLNAGVRVGDVQQKRGAEAAARVRALLPSNAHLRDALDLYEKRGLHSKIDSAVVVSGNAQHTNSSANVVIGCSLAAQNASSGVSAQDVVAGDGVELIFIPAYIAPGWWEGTVDARRYDAYGNLLDEYIANTVITSPDPDTAFDVVDETVVYDGVSNPPPIDPTYVDEPMPEYPIYAMSVPTPSSKGSVAQRPRKGGAAVSSLASPGKIQSKRWLGRWGAWGKCGLAWCGGAAVGCGVGNWWNAEIAWGPCTAIGCIGGAIGCTYGTLWD